MFSLKILNVRGYSPQPAAVLGTSRMIGRQADSEDVNWVTDLRLTMGDADGS